MSNTTDDAAAWPVVNILCRYKVVPSSVLSGAVPDSVRKLSITVQRENTDRRPERRADFDAQIKTALRLFSARYPDRIKVDASLYQTELPSDFIWGISGQLSIGHLLSALGMEENGDEYYDIGARMGYYMENGILHFCTTRTAQQRLSAWWSGLSSKEREKIKN